jgi:hypothetical protein
MWIPKYHQLKTEVSSEVSKQRYHQRYLNRGIIGGVKTEVSTDVSKQKYNQSQKRGVRTYSFMKCQHDMWGNLIRSMGIFTCISYSMQNPPPMGRRNTCTASSLLPQGPGCVEVSLEMSLRTKLHSAALAGMLNLCFCEHVHVL